MAALSATRSDQLNLRVEMAERIERDDDLPAAVGLAIRQNLAKEAVAGDAIQLREASESLEGESALARS